MAGLISISELPLSSPIIGLLPNELLHLIATKSTPGTLVNLMLTNKHFFVICAPIIQGKALTNSYYTTAAIFWAAITGNNKFLSELISNAGSIDVIDVIEPRSFSQDDLHQGMFKVISKDPVQDLMAFVIKQGEKLLLRQSQMSLYTSPISWAAEKNHIGLLKLVLRKGTKVDERNHLGQTPLQIALINGNEDMASCLLTEFSPRVNTVDRNSKTPLILALENCTISHKVVKSLLLLGANPHYKIDSEPLKGWMPLHFATFMCNEEGVKLLLSYRVNLNAGVGFDTPLHLAAAKKNGGDIAMLLLKAGSSATFKSSTRKTAFELAEASENSAVGELLCALWGSGVYEPLDDGRTFTHLAARHSQIGLLAQLLDMKRDIEKEDKTGQRPLHAAAGSSCDVAVKALVAAGAGLDCIDKDGRAPVHIAATIPGLEVYNALLKLGSRCALERDFQGRTAVRTAAWTIEYPGCVWVGFDGHQRRDMAKKVEERERQLLKEICGIRMSFGGYLLG